MSSTPRAEQFEDRLKTIIHSVLSGDDKNHPKGPLNIQANASAKMLSSANSSNMKPMFSPVKKELPSHLPMPPSNVVTDKTFMRSVQMRPQQSQGPSHRLPTMNSAITMNEIIEKEIEKNLGGEPQHRRPPGGPPISPQRLARHNSIPPQPQQASIRLSQVIEDSLRNHPGSRQSQVIEDTLRNHPGSRPSDLEGLACPRTKSPTPAPAVLMASSSRPLGPPPQSSGYPGGRPPHGPPNEDFHAYPAMEGLGARFSSIMEKRHASVPVSSAADVIERSFSHPPKREPWDHQHGPPQPHPQDHPNYRYPNGPYPPPPHHQQQQQQQPRDHGHGPPQPPPPMAGNSYGIPPRKRASPSSNMPPAVLPPKKQHMDMPEELRYQKGKLKRKTVCLI